MQILRVYPANLSAEKNQLEDKLIRKKKRIKALGLTMPKGKKFLYYSNETKQRAEDFAAVIGNIELKPLSSLELLGDEEYVIIVDKPENIKREIREKTGFELDYKSSMAVLTDVNILGYEKVIWHRESKDWIYFAFPNEEILPVRTNSDISLKELVLPKIRERYDLIINNLHDFIERPEDPTTVHQYRVSMRSFRSIISLIKPIIPFENYLKIQDIFRQRGREAEQLRELDVLIKEWDKSRRNAKKLRADLLKERKKEEKRLHQQLCNGSAEGILDAGLILLLNNLDKSNWEYIDGIELLDSRLKGWYRFTLEGIWEMNDFVFPKVHRIRLKSKKYRYVSEIFAEYLTEDQLEYHEAAKGRQKVLGKVCDSLRNQEAVVELLPKIRPQATQEANSFINVEEVREHKLLTKLGLKEDKPLLGKAASAAVSKMAVAISLMYGIFWIYKIFLEGRLGLSDNLKTVISHLVLYGPGLALCAMVVRKIVGETPKKRKLEFRTFFVSFLLQFTVLAIFFGLNMLNNPMANAPFTPLSPFSLVILLVVSPVLEELVFRKLFAHKLLEHGDYLYMFLSSLCFSLVHAFAMGWPTIIATFLLGMIWSYIYMRTGKLIVPIVLHSLYNLFGSVLTRYISDNYPDMLKIYLVGLLVLALLGLISLIINRKKISIDKSKRLVDWPSIGKVFSSPGFYFFLMLVALSVILKQHISLLY